MQLELYPTEALYNVKAKEQAHATMDQFLKTKEKHYSVS